MKLGTAQKSEIFQNGYTILRGAVAPDAVGTALRAINASLGANGMHPDELDILRSQTYCRELVTTPPITDLFNASPLFSVWEQLLGEGAVPHQDHAQIALRFPKGDGAQPGIAPPHLDGMSSPRNGVPPQTFGNFTALCGVLLSDVPEPFMGNFTAWPGTHRLYEKYFQEYGVEKFLEGVPQVELPEPQQFTGRAGDAILCHYQLGHGVAANLSPFIRYAVFFRLEHPAHNSHRKEVLTDIWRDWPGIAGIKAED
jgi:hypothetical protein